MKAPILALSGLVCSLTSPLLGQEIELYSTDFSEFPVGTDELAGKNGWDSLVKGEAVHGIDSEIFDDVGNSAFIGYNPPPGEFSSVWRAFQYDPIAEGTPMFHFSGDIAIIDSENDSFDNFYISIWNTDLEFLASINFDNITQTLYRERDAERFEALDVDFVGSRIYRLEFTINFEENTWSATLGDETLFTNATFHTGGKTLDVESVDFEWQVTDRASPGDNWMYFDNIRVSVSPTDTSPPESPSIEMFTLNEDQEPEITWNTSPGIQYQVQFSENLENWSNSLPGSTFTGPADGSSLTYQDPTADLSDNRYYRVTVIEDD